MPGRYRGSSDDQGFIEYEFELNENNVGNLVDGRFPGAITDFSFSSNPFDFDKQPVSISNITLDLIPKFVPDVDSFGQIRDQIEYTFADIPGQTILQESLAKIDAPGASKLTLIIRDQSDEEGFQFNPGSTEFDDDFNPIYSTISVDEASGRAISDINFIFEEDLLGSITNYNFFDDPSMQRGSFDAFDTIFPKESGEGIIIQAEDLTLDTYQVETLTTGDEVISLLNASGLTGTASLIVRDFGLEIGTYDLTISYFDENDGEAQLEVLLNGIPVNAAGNPIMLTENTSSGFTTEDVRREFVIEGIEITNPSDVISIVGIADGDISGGEWARVDFLTFTEVEA